MVHVLFCDDWLSLQVIATDYVLFLYRVVRWVDANPSHI